MVRVRSGPIDDTPDAVHVSDYGLPRIRILPSDKSLLKARGTWSHVGAKLFDPSAHKAE